MAKFILKFVLGEASPHMSGQWIEGLVEFGEKSFSLSADVCRKSDTDEFSMYRLHERLDRPFTAELFLGLLSLIAEVEFRPSKPGFELSYSGDGPAPREEIIRILEPEVRVNASAALVPVSVADRLEQQMRRISLIRQIQAGMAYAEA